MLENSKTQTQPNAITRKLHSHRKRPTKICSAMSKKTSSLLRAEQLGPASHAVQGLSGLLWAFVDVVHGEAKKYRCDGQNILQGLLKAS